MKQLTHLAVAIGLVGTLIADVALAKVADDPPGSAFQDRGFREYLGLSPFGRPRQTVRADNRVYGIYAHVTRGVRIHQHRSVARNYRK
jgi:hypothetical protein